MLTARKKQFAKEYLIDLNAAQAAIRAGYSPKAAKEQGSRLLTDVNVRQIIDTKLAERSKRCEISADYVLTNLQDIVEMFKVENPGASLKGLELLGKNLKLFTDRLEIRVINSVDDLTDEERAKVIESIRAKRLALPGG